MRLKGTVTAPDDALQHLLRRCAPGVTLVAMVNSAGEYKAAGQVVLRRAVRDGWTRRQILDTWSMLFGGGQDG